MPKDREAVDREPPLLVERELPPDERDDVPLPDRELLLVERDPVPLDRDDEAVEREPPLEERDVPLVDREAPLVDRDPPDVERDVPLEERDVPLVERESVPLARDEVDRDPVPDREVPEVLRLVLRLPVLRVPVLRVPVLRVPVRPRVVVRRRGDCASSIACGRRSAIRRPTSARSSPPSCCAFGSISLSSSSM